MGFSYNILYIALFLRKSSYCDVGEWFEVVGANLLSRSTIAKNPNPNLATVSRESKQGKSKSTSPSSSAIYRA